MLQNSWCPPVAWNRVHAMPYRVVEGRYLISKLLPLPMVQHSPRESRRPSLNLR